VVHGDFPLDFHFSQSNSARLMSASGQQQPLKYGQILASERPVSATSGHSVIDWYSGRMTIPTYGEQQ